MNSLEKYILMKKSQVVLTINYSLFIANKKLSFKIIA